MKDFRKIDFFSVDFQQDNIKNNKTEDLGLAFERRGPHNGYDLHFGFLKTDWDKKTFLNL